MRENRQTRLAEVGAEGQARIESSSVRVRQAGLAGWVEERYLRGAGARVLAAQAPEEAALPFEIEDDAAASVARGAWSALTSIKKIL